VFEEYIQLEKVWSLNSPQSSINPGNKKGSPPAIILTNIPSSPASFWCMPDKEGKNF